MIELCTQLEAKMPEEVAKKVEAEQTAASKKNQMMLQMQGAAISKPEQKGSFQKGQ